ncbi:MAG: DNA-binding protein [Deltaproteobacteria bacterium]|nr:DNA-binding protein [Deltaproteobacteria bacterium]
MRTAEGTVGRVFVLRLEDGDRIPECIERFAAEKGLLRAFCTLLGGIGEGRLVVGPEDATGRPVVPMTLGLVGVHEIAAVGTLFPAEDGTARLHMHGALGREDETRTGCVRQGVDVWQVAEAVVVEIVGTNLVRKLDPVLGFQVLSEP